MSRSTVQEAYAQILEESRRRGEVLADASAKERRLHPRLAVNAADLWISSVPEYSMVDMSASGIAILANYPLKRGEVISLSLGRSIKIEAEVLHCQLVESATQWQDAMFRIHCKFAEEGEGMELLVEVKRRDHAN